MIYTSFFDRMEIVPNPVSIALESPLSYSGPKASWLAPKKDFLVAYKKGIINPEQYTKRYHAQILNALDPHASVVELMDCYKDNFGKPLKNQIITLLCYEKPGEFCHRHLVAEWLGAAGYETKEWNPEDTSDSHE